MRPVLYAVIPRAFLNINLRAYAAILIHPYHHPFLHEAPGLVGPTHFHNASPIREGNSDIARRKLGCTHVPTAGHARNSPHSPRI